MEASYIITYIIFGGFLGALSVTTFNHFSPKEKKPIENDYQAQINSLRQAMHDVQKELAAKSPLKISRIENKELFDRLDELAKTDRTPIVRHEHYYTELPKGSKPTKNPLGKGVTSLFPETNI